MLSTKLPGFGVDNPLRLKLFAVSVQSILQRGGSGFMETNVQEELCQGEMPNFGVSERTRVSLPRARTRGPLNSQVVLIQIQFER